MSCSISDACYTQGSAATSNEFCIQQTAERSRLGLPQRGAAAPGADVALHVALQAWGLAPCIACGWLTQQGVTSVVICYNYVIIGVRKEFDVEGRQILMFWYRNQIYAIRGALTSRRRLQ